MGELGGKGKTKSGFVTTFLCSPTKRAATPRVWRVTRAKRATSVLGADLPRLPHVLMYGDSHRANVDENREGNPRVRRILQPGPFGRNQSGLTQRHEATKGRSYPGTSHLVILVALCESNSLNLRQSAKSVAQMQFSAAVNLCPVKLYLRASAFIGG
jgi:hypothetical protein